MIEGDEKLARVTSLSAWSSGRSVAGRSPAASTEEAAAAERLGDGDSDSGGASGSESGWYRDSSTSSSSDALEAQSPDAGDAEPDRPQRSPMHPAGSALRRAADTESAAEPRSRGASVAGSDDLGERAGAEGAGRGAGTTSTTGAGGSRRPENVSMHALTRRGMSRWELEKLLVTREVDPEQVETELARLESVGLVDDQALAETVVRAQHERKGLSRSALRAELRRRHIDDEQIGAALEGIDDDAELGRARQLAQRRAPQLANLDPVTAARRLSGYIARKGYSSAVVRTVVDEALTRPHSGVRFDD